MNHMDNTDEDKTCSHPAIALAMAYVPCQEFDNIYDSDIGISRGTIFEELDKPFIGEEAARR